jgi:ATP-dependent DNA helicase DinG
MQEELGLRRLHPAAAVCAVDSPFDYDRQTLFLAPADIPAPDQAEFVVTVASLLRGLWQSVRRRTLVLFTSYLQLQKVAQALAEDPATMELFATVPGAGVGRGEIIVQNSAADTAELLTRFRRRPASLLLGTTSFWEGVDFPGADLELLVVCKLPFAVPTDPWVEARCEKLQAGGENPFTNFMVRDAVLRLRQGVGRLIRSQSDRGVLVLLDNRLHGKSYGMTFRGALPAAVHVCRDVADVIQKSAAFFRQVDEEAAGRHPG